MTAGTGSRLQGRDDIVVQAPARILWRLISDSHELPDWGPPVRSVEVMTNAADAEQALAMGASVNVRLKSGSNETHGAAFEYNIITKFAANNFFSNLTGVKRPHLVDNNPGASIGGHIIKDKLFYFGSYEGDYYNAAASGILSLPNATMLSGNLSGSPNAIYDPATGNANGTGRTEFAGKMIPASRVDPVVAKLLPHFPAVTYPNQSQNNAFINQGTVYNLHKIDTKIDYQVTPNLRVSGRYGYQPYFNQQNPFFGQFLGGSSGGWAQFSQNGAGNYLQNGATLAVSGSVTYLFSPTLIIDGTFGVTQPHQLLFPTNTNTKVGLDTLGIPGTNIGALPWSGGMPDFDIGGYPSSTSTTFGYSYPPLEYKDPVFEYVANLTKIKGSHNIRVGEDVVRLHMNHKEVRNTVFQFTGGVTSTPGGASPGPYNGVADFLLGLPQTTNVWFQPEQPYITLREYDFSVYARDQWQASHKLTINYGLRWELFPVPTTAKRGIQYNNLLSDINNPTMELCGVGGNPGDCGIKVSHKLFAPSLGIAYRVDDNTVVRAGFALSPTQVEMGNSGTQAFPATVQGVYNGANSYLPASTTLATGFPTIPTPVPDSHGNVAIPFGAGNVNTLPKNFVRGYIQSWNFSLEQKLPADIVTGIAYVGTQTVHQMLDVDINAAPPGGGPAGRPLAATQNRRIAMLMWDGAASGNYHSLQLALNRQFSRGLFLKGAYTWSKAINWTDEDGWTGAPNWNWQPVMARNRAVAGYDRAQMFTMGFLYEAPFGPGKKWAADGLSSWLLRGWQTNGLFAAYTGTPFTISGSGTELNAPGNSQTADLVKSGTVAIPGEIGANKSWFDPLAFRQPTGVRFGTTGRNTMFGPGLWNLDMSVFRTFKVMERIKLEFKAECFNITNTPKFSNPGAGVASMVLNSDGTVRTLNNFSSITSTLGGLANPSERQFRFGLRFSF